MKELFQRIKLDVIISALCCIVFGTVLMIWPTEVTTIACKAIAAVIAVLGLIRIISYIMNKQERHGINLPLGLVLLFVGIWIYLKPYSIQSMLLIGIGVVLFVHGFEDFKYALETRHGGYEFYWVILLMAVFGMGLGIACIFDCFGVISVALAFVGVALIYDGITDLWIIFQVTKTAKEMRSKMEGFQAVDADAEIVAEAVELDVTEESEM